MDLPPMNANPELFGCLDLSMRQEPSCSYEQPGRQEFGNQESFEDQNSVAMQEQGECYNGDNPMDPEPDNENEIQVEQEIPVYPFGGVLLTPASVTDLLDEVIRVTVTAFGILCDRIEEFHVPVEHIIHPEIYNIPIEVRELFDTYVELDFKVAVTCISKLAEKYPEPEHLMEALVRRERETLDDENVSIDDKQFIVDIYQNRRLGRYSDGSIRNGFNIFMVVQ